MRSNMFVPNHIYRRRALHDEYGGQNQGGISTPVAQPFIFLFSTPSGAEFGYQDGWEHVGYYRYFGEGQYGDMQFLRGNLAIRNHAANGKDLLLFIRDTDVPSAHVRFVGHVVCSGYHEVQAKDTVGNVRRAIIFELTPLEAFAESVTPDNALSATLATWNDPLGELRQRAYETSTDAPTPVERMQNTHKRSEAVKIYVLRRANGICEGCQTIAPFFRPDGRPYLEPHHTRRLTDGGPDDPRWVIGLCPNCHRRAHYSKDARTFNLDLIRIVQAKETNY
jgi:5-methylcytosine-specific restriction enzyme A